MNRTILRKGFVAALTIIGCALIVAAIWYLRMSVATRLGLLGLFVLIVAVVLVEKKDAQ